MQSQSMVSDIEEQLFTYFDDELEAGERETLEAELERDEELAARLADLSFMRAMVVGDLDAQAERVPEARFEQIWDNFEATLERESRLQEAAEEPPGVWQRLVDWMQPRRIPIAAVGVVGGLALLFAFSAGKPGHDEGAVAANTQEEEPSDAQPTTQAPTDPSPQTQPVPAPATQPDDEARLAAAPDPSPDPEIDPDVFPQPEPGEAEIRRIEFGGRTGTISQVEGARGTTTVIWVTEDEAPVDSERSL